ncbi:MAG TPA: pilus assembly protein N-terminal domain-containing protein [Rhizomicrobium sp.]|nr:pilus assembly protein N-terminal domain-containing protein [Rhizomicrobium sp.]
MRRFVRLAFIAAASLAAVPAFAGTLTIPLDEVRMVTFLKPAATVYVGNPMIADITVIDSKHVFVLGKAFGVTNIIALDQDGKQIVSNPLTVMGRGADIVTLNRGSSQVTYTCAGARCEAAPLPGDAKETYDATMGQIGLHQEMGVKAASAEGVGH